MKNRTLFLFTQTYPYGTGEPFIENELKLLSKDFRTVYVFPLKKEGKRRPLPNQNIEIVYLFEKQKIRKWKSLFNNILLVIKILFFEFQAAKSPLNFLKSLSMLKSVLLVNLYRASELSNFIRDQKNDNITFYSFWTDDWATVLSILKRKNIINSFFTRGHGYDIYEERWKMSLIPFRNFQLECLSLSFVVSQDALNYMIRHYPQHESKFKLNHLSVFSKGENPFNEKISVLTVVSCANLIPLKRVELIAEILKNVSVNVNWIHFGDGPLKGSIMEQVRNLPSNITVDFRGHVNNDAIIEFYQTQCVNLFIHVSETEGGVPISLQEAASFGIPLIGTNVGGIPEIVKEKTGILLEKDFEPLKVAEIISKFEKSEKNTREFRAGVRLFWKENFDAVKNYHEFYKLIS